MLPNPENRHATDQKALKDDGGELAKEYAELGRNYEAQRQFRQRWASREAAKYTVLRKQIQSREESTDEVGSYEGDTKISELEASDEAAANYVKSCEEMHKNGVKFRGQDMVRWGPMTKRKEYLYIKAQFRSSMKNVWEDTCIHEGVGTAATSADTSGDSLETPPKVRRLDSSATTTAAIAGLPILVELPRANAGARTLKPAEEPGAQGQPTPPPNPTPPPPNPEEPKKGGQDGEDNGGGGNGGGGNGGGGTGGEANGKGGKGGKGGGRGKGTPKERKEIDVQIDKLRLLKKRWNAVQSECCNLKECIGSDPAWSWARPATDLTSGMEKLSELRKNSKFFQEVLVCESKDLKKYFKEDAISQGLVALGQLDMTIGALEMESSCLKAMHASRVDVRKGEMP